MSKKVLVFGSGISGIGASRLLESMGKERFLTFLKNANEINALSETLLERSIDHYREYFQ